MDIVTSTDTFRSRLSISAWLSRGEVRAIVNGDDLGLPAFILEAVRRDGPDWLKTEEVAALTVSLTPLTVSP